jgi:cell division protein FtsA
LTEVVGVCVFVRRGLEVDQLMLNPLASSMAVLTQDERDLGVALVDISAGGPATDVAIFCRRRGRHRRDPSAGDLILATLPWRCAPPGTPRDIRS